MKAVVILGCSVLLLCCSNVLSVFNSKAEREYAKELEQRIDKLEEKWREDVKMRIVESGTTSCILHRLEHLEVHTKAGNPCAVGGRR